MALPKIFVFLDQYEDLIFNNNITDIGIIYRNYEHPEREKELIKIAKACKKKRYKLFVSNDIKLAIKTKADGIYIPSFNKIKRFNNTKNKNFTILGSAHNQKEIKEKISQNCKAIFLGPAFHVEKRKKFLGINKFNILTRLNNINAFALGGINEKNLSKLRLLNIKGYAGIKMFKKKTGLKKAGFLKN
tara:strand:- start:279 stop:842 length:564 start_codon:yes stop_codon:yes gene_type:complete